jgi:hypothetical protein
MPKLYPSPLSEKDVADVAAYVQSLDSGQASAKPKRDGFTEREFLLAAAHDQQRAEETQRDEAEARGGRRDDEAEQ